MPSSDQAVYASVDSSFVEGTPVGIPLYRQRDENGVVPQSPRQPPRREWWLRPLPAKSWLLGFSLRTGVAWTALGLILLGGRMLYIYISIPGFLATLRRQYTEGCGWRAAKSHRCIEKAKEIDRLVDMGSHRLLMMLVGVARIVPGTIGLAAAYRADPRAVKLFRWVYVALCIADHAQLFTELGNGVSSAFAMLIAMLIILPQIYNEKVMTSYEMLLMRRRNRGVPPSSDVPAGGATELDSFSKVV